MNFDQMMAELRADYIASMPQKIDEIKKLATANDISVAEAAALRELFHKLKGSGKTYGINEVSELFEVCEKIFLNKSQNLSQIVVLALKLFTAIYAARKNGESFNVIASEDFNILKSYL